MHLLKLTLALAAIAKTSLATSCSLGYDCECYYQNTKSRCATKSVYEAMAVEAYCDCPDSLDGNPFDRAECINLGEYNDRHKC